MILSFDKFERYELPQVTLCNPNSRATEVDGKITITDTVGVLSNPKGMNLKLNFNAPHEISFDYYRHKSSDPIKQSFYDKIYEAIQTDRYVYLTDIGYFIISSVTDSDEDNIDKKSITCKSCEENELATAEGLYLEEGTYYLCTEDNQGLLDLFLPKTAGWTMGYIDPSLLTKPYFVEDTEVDNGYNFLYTTVQDMYECIVEPDIIKRTISVYSRVYYAEHHLTDIHIAKYNLLKHKTVEENDEDKYTALNVQGKDENLEIRAVNPTGKNVIYNFEPRYAWMSSALQQAIEKWQEKCESVEEEYLTLQQGYYTELEKLFNEEQDIEVLKGELKTLEETRDAVLITTGEEQSTALDNVNAQISAKQTEINTATTNYNTHKNNVHINYEIPIAQINSDCALDTTAIDIDGNSIFTVNLLNELMTHIKPTDYVDEYMLVTESMTYPQRFEKAKELMNRAQSQLVKISSGQKTYSIDTRSFLFNKQFKHFSEQLCAGAIIYVETKSDIMEQLHLTGIDINFDEKSTNFTLGNKYNRSDLKALYEDALGQNSKSFSELKYIASIIEDQQKQLDYQRNWTADLRTLTLDNVLTSEDQAIEINNRGLIGRKRRLDENGEWDFDENGNPYFEDEQVKLINNTLVFTEDNWQTASTAVGKIAVGYDDEGNVKYAYGINGQVLIGELILGNNLVLTGTGAGIKIKDADGNDAFYADEDGNLVLSGKIFANEGNIAGWEIEEKKSNINANRFIVFIGDSYGQGYNPDAPIENGWPGKVAPLINLGEGKMVDFNGTLFGKIGRGDKWINNSLGGTGFASPTEGRTFLTLLQEVKSYLDSNSANILAENVTDIVIGGGFNDYTYIDIPYDEYSSYIINKIAEFNQYVITNFPNAKVSLFCLGWCTDNYTDNTKVKNDLQRLYDAHYMSCKAGCGWDYYDIHTWADDTGDSNSLFSSDYYHPNEAGLERVALLVAEILGNVIKGGRLYYNPFGYNSNERGFYLSNIANEWAIELGSKFTDYTSVGGGKNYRRFMVGQNGDLWASNAHLIGNIVANYGNIGGWSISRDKGLEYYGNDSTAILCPNGSQIASVNGYSRHLVLGIGSPSDLKFAVDISGAVYATSGTIAGWNMQGNSLIASNDNFRVEFHCPTSNDPSTPNADVLVVTKKEEDLVVDYPFALRANGELYATKATITGTIKAVGGSVGGWIISDKYLYSANGKFGDYKTSSGTALNTYSGYYLFIVLSNDPDRFGMYYIIANNSDLSKANELIWCENKPEGYNPSIAI